MTNKITVHSLRGKMTKRNGVFIPYSRAKNEGSSSTEKLDCPYCGNVNTIRYKSRPGMCQECGRKYENFRKLKVESPRYQEYARYYEEQKNKGLRTPKYDLREAVVIMETERRCKQCGQTKDISSYRKNAARGRGVYKTKQGYHRSCKECESINITAIRLEKDPESDPVTYDKLKKYYKALNDMGYGIASAVAGRYLGVDKTGDEAAQGGSLLDRLDAVIDMSKDAEHLEAINFMSRLRGRMFEGPDEAGVEYESLKPLLNEAGLRDEAAELLDDWDEEVGYE